MNYILILKEAIAKLHKIKMVYDGFTRIVEPYLIGENKKGKLMLRAFQTEGKSVSGEGPGWRLFELDKMTAVEILPLQFNASRSEYNPEDKAMRKVITSI